MSWMKKSNPRVKIHENGSVTLSGLHYRDLRAILTSASLWRHKQRENVEPGSVGWAKKLSALISLTETRISDEIIKSHSCDDRPMEEAMKRINRIAAAHKARENRLETARIMKAMFPRKP